MVAGEDGEDAVESGDFVDDEGEVDEFGGGAKRDEVEQALITMLISACGVSVWRLDGADILAVWGIG